MTHGRVSISPDAELGEVVDTLRYANRSKRLPVVSGTQGRWHHQPSQP